ncbi:SET domain-containing protein SmydA-8-like [Sabethes cyaneus]|uniref:SET domain-containing protein SmydA-8-like n=1 Tax=Sabethes cyaneus TaxID=53552 RepID=UPI00237EC151|nr:SET domain-containing protein SmydA-8-like [Sabethes cyaneus]
MAQFEENCEISKSNELGRFLIAKRDLARGQLVLVDQPFAIGPYWDSEIVCLNCFRNSCTICRKCRRAPLCYECVGHNESECDFYQDSNLDINFLFNHFNVVTVVRCLLLFPNNRPKFDEMMRMEAHLEARRGSEIWNIHEQCVVRPLLESSAFQKHTDLDLTGELIQRICGILDVNAFEIRANVDNQGINYLARALYPKTALMTHNCVSNTLISVDGQYNVKVYATVPVSKGDLLYYNYTRSLFGTFERRAHLRRGKYFLCSCARCNDPTELGSHLSSVQCTACEDGLCSYYTKDTKWQCSKCGKQIDRDYVKQAFTSARKDAMTCSSDIDDLERIISRHSKTLNPHNSLVLEMKQTLAGELRNLCQSSHPVDIPKQILVRKLELCGEMLQILRVLEPGISRLTGIALYEHNMALWYLGKHDFESKSISCGDLLHQLVDAENGLKESISMLLFDHPTTPEGQLSKRAMCELKELREEISQVKALVEDARTAKATTKCSKKKMSKQK